MTTRDYDSDANFFAYYFPITTPSQTITHSRSLSSLYSYRGLTRTAWP